MTKKSLRLQLSACVMGTVLQGEEKRSDII